MSHAQTLVIANEYDIILLRMQVRDLARAVGLNLGDQARISLAASSAAQVIGLGATQCDQVTIESCYRDGRAGVRVVCTTKNGKADHTPYAFGDTRWMVDELTCETLPSKEMQVTLVKWQT
jgi:hypothetical protein